MGKQGSYEKIQIQDPTKFNWFDILDENGDVLLRVSVSPLDAYHLKRGRVGLAHNQRDVNSVFLWSDD
jgi:hypothetical protein